MRLGYRIQVRKLDDVALQKEYCRAIQAAIF